jgi:hypothetical protein
LADAGLAEALVEAALVEVVPDPFAVVGLELALPTVVARARVTLVAGAASAGGGSAGFVGSVMARLA